MDLSDARQRLTGTDRHELRDHSFGDCEVTWVRGDQKVATGYFGSNSAWVRIGLIQYDGEMARALLQEGNLVVHRNDTTGPDEYQEGKVMPGLTKEGVYKELTGQDWIEPEI